jgi:disulfide bond formation protein DsbB
MTTLTRVERETQIARIINVLALLALIGVLAGSLHLQFGVGEQPCPLCLIQRSAMIGLAVGPLMNLLWGIRPAHYALSILAAVVGGAASTRQILLHIATPGDPGYGPAVMGLHLYTWALVTFVIAIVGCSILLLWPAPFSAPDEGIWREPGWLRVAALTAIVWVLVDLVVIAISTIPECGVGMCPDDPDPLHGMGEIPGWAFVMSLGLISFAIAMGIVLDRRLPGRRQA